MTVGELSNRQLAETRVRAHTGYEYCSYSYGTPKQLFRGNGNNGCKNTKDSRISRVDDESVVKCMSFARR